MPTIGRKNDGRLLSDSGLNDDETVKKLILSKNRRCEENAVGVSMERLYVFWCLGPRCDMAEAI